MKVRITDDCVSCGQCVDVCPEVFDLGAEKAVVKLDPIPDVYTSKVKEAADVCPVSAIELTT